MLSLPARNAQRSLGSYACLLTNFRGAAGLKLLLGSSDLDFVSDVAASGRRLRIFTVVDSYTREWATIKSRPNSQIGQRCGPSI